MPIQIDYHNNAAKKKANHTYSTHKLVETPPDSCQTKLRKQLYLPILYFKDRAIPRSIIPNLFWRLMESRRGNKEMKRERETRYHKEYGFESNTC